MQEQLRQTRDRFNVGEVTRTDVAQSESRLASGRSQVLSAEAIYKASVATYRQVIGVEPGKLTPARRSTGSRRTICRSRSECHRNPSAGDQRAIQCRCRAVAGEGCGRRALSDAVGAGQRAAEQRERLLQLKTFNAVGAGPAQRADLPGRRRISLIRQAKETLGQQRLNLDVARDQVRQNVVQSWGQLDAAKANIDATQSQVQAAEMALNGVREEARVGQRTTLDVLNAQQELVNARVALVSAQRDRVVASYTLLASVGRLSPQVLALRVPVYDFNVHYQQVRDTWAGVRTPDGR